MLALAVVLGAFGTHAWSDVLGDKMYVFKTAIQYHFIHSLGIILLVILGNIYNVDMKNAALFLLLGVIGFSGSLYMLAFPAFLPAIAFKILGPITPVGGLFFILGWSAAALKFFRKK